MSARTILIINHIISILESAGLGHLELGFSFAHTLKAETKTKHNLTSYKYHDYNFTVGKTENKNFKNPGIMTQHDSC